MEEEGTMKIMIAYWVASMESLISTAVTPHVRYRTCATSETAYRASWLPGQFCSSDEESLDEDFGAGTS
ncbi:hypothetical protein TNCV_1659551 [Trichonephila clavipes]|nr:hypothetical protein TNCV_1659551 [Trichonephila clavipes]